MNFYSSIKNPISDKPNYGIITRQLHVSSVRYDDSAKKDDDDIPPSNEKKEEEEKLETLHTPLVMPSMNALAPQTVPELLPQVPCLAIARNPLFPRFVKMLEITDPKLIELVRRKVHLNVPFVGVFMRKSAER